jgi:ribosomal protein S18 acetylase RimI-like enzyme
MSKIVIRLMNESDCTIISELFQAQGWDKPLSLYERYYAEQLKNARDVYVAEFNNEIAGYVTIQWQSPYDYFQQNNIPEIKDLNTLIIFRNRGIATALMNIAEKRVQEKGYSIIGLGVGLYSDYGIAQRMYVKRGYIFDGRGLLQNGKVIKPGASVVVDDCLTLGMFKELL